MVSHTYIITEKTFDLKHNWCISTQKKNIFLKIMKMCPKTPIIQHFHSFCHHLELKKSCTLISTIIDMTIMKTNYGIFDVLI